MSSRPVGESCVRRGSLRRQVELRSARSASRRRIAACDTSERFLLLNAERARSPRLGDALPATQTVAQQDRSSYRVRQRVVVHDTWSRRFKLPTPVTRGEMLARLAVRVSTVIGPRLRPPRPPPTAASTEVAAASLKPPPDHSGRRAPAQLRRPAWPLWLRSGRRTDLHRRPRQPRPRR